MSTTAEKLRAEKLLFEVTFRVGNEQMTAASRLLSQHDDGFWLRQFLEPDDFATKRRYERATEMDYTPRVTPGLVRTRIKSLIRQTGQAPLVVIDYIQLMYTDQRNSRQTTYDRVSEVSREIKIIAEETGAVIICCAQLNRGSEHREGKIPQTSDLRDSGQLEQDASAIVLLHREDAYTPESPRAGESDMILGKNRNGPTTTITVAHQFHYSRLRDMSRDTEGDL